MEYLRSEVVESIANTGVDHGFAVFTDVSVTWNALRTRDARVDVGWFDREDERFVAAWVLQGTATAAKTSRQQRPTSAALLDGCPAALKIEVVDDARPAGQSSNDIVQVLAHEVARPTSKLNRLTSLAATACVITPAALLRFFHVHLPDALPVIPRDVQLFSFGVSWVQGISTHPKLMTRRWISRAHRFLEAPHVPDNFYAAGMVGTQAEECIFVMWGGPKRFWFREPYMSFAGGEASIETMRRSFDANVREWGLELAVSR